MTRIKIHKNFKIVGSILMTIGIIVLLLKINNYWPFNSNDFEKSEENTNNFSLTENKDHIKDADIVDLTEKIINIYLKRNKNADKHSVKLKCFSFQLILKSLTGDRSDEMFNYLGELGVSDIESFKNFVFSIYSEFVSNNNEAKIFRIFCR